MNLTEKIKQCRRAKNLTQAELAKLIKVSPMTVRRWEWGQRQPRTNEIAKLAEALGTTVGALMGETSEPEVAPKDPGENLPINNAPETVNNQSENLGLGYWGSVADNARKVAARGDKREIALITPLLRSALEVITGEEPQEETAHQVIGVNGNIHGGKNNVNVSTG